LFERVTLAYSGQHRVRDESLRTFQVRLQVKSPATLLDSLSSTADPRNVATDRRSRAARLTVANSGLTQEPEVAP